MMAWWGGYLPFTTLVFFLANTQLFIPATDADPMILIKKSNIWPTCANRVAGDIQSDCFDDAARNLLIDTFLRLNISGHYAPVGAWDCSASAPHWVVGKRSDCSIYEFNVYASGLSKTGCELLTMLFNGAVVKCQSQSQYVLQSLKWTGVALACIVGLGCIVVIVRTCRSAVSSRSTLPNSYELHGIRVGDHPAAESNETNPCQSIPEYTQAVEDAYATSPSPINENKGELSEALPTYEQASEETHRSRNENGGKLPKDDHGQSEA